MDKFIGIIGLGYWGKNVFRNLYELGVLRSASDNDPKAIFEYAKQFPDARLESSFEAILQDKEIMAVAIVTPAVTHFDMVRKALLAGKDVFVEKPLALVAREGEELVRIAEEKKKILMVGHILLYHPALKRLKTLISEGALGKIQYIYSNRLNIGKLRTEENILWSFAPHDISAILELVEEEPIRVTCFGGDYLNQGIYDTTLTALEFRNGLKGHIFVSWLHPYKEQKLIVVGSEAMAVFDDMTEEKLFLYHHKIEWKEGKIPIAHKAEYEVVNIEKQEPLKVELEHFIQCVKDRSKPKTDGVEGLKVLRVLNLCAESLSKK